MFIYLITNTRNGKRYVGQSKTPQKRWAWHRSMFRHRDSRLYRAMRKHGIDSFTFEIVACALAAEFVSTLEIELIRKFGAYSNGYNSTLGGEGIRGCPQSEQTKEKIAASKRGKARSSETVEKMRVAATGRACPTAAREKLRIAMTDRVVSDVTRQKISRAHKGKTISEEHKQALRVHWTGATPTDETRRKLSAARTGKKHSAETLLKLSQRATAREQRRREARAEM